MQAVSRQISSLLWPAGSVEASLNLNNPLGYAEQISLTAEYGSQSTNVYSFAVTKPRPSGLPVLLDLRLNQLFHRCSGPAADGMVLWLAGAACRPFDSCRAAKSQGVKHRAVLVILCSEQPRGCEVGTCSAACQTATAARNAARLIQKENGE
jgi:hypothetical protein